MQKKITRFLWTGFAGVQILCIVVFIFLAVSVNRQSNSTVNEIGEIYMTQMGTQIQMHFKTAAEMYYSELREIGNLVETEQAIDESWEIIMQEAEVNGFEYLAVYSEDKSEKIIGGESVTISDSDAFFEAVKNEEIKVTDGKTVSGETLLLFGIYVSASMNDGTEGGYLVAGVPEETIIKELSLDEGETQMYSHIIRSDGDFVIKNGNATEENYFERLRNSTDIEGYTNEEMVEILKEVMEEGRSYYLVAEYDGIYRNSYITPLEYSDWYLVSSLSYNILEEPINGLLHQRILIFAVGFGAILAAVLLIFIQYSRMTRRQVKELNRLRKEAEQANQAKSEFLSNISHDIRTPMNAIVGMTAIAAANIYDTEKVKNCLKKITLSSEHLLGLINDVLDMSKIESGKMTLNVDLISLREVMENLVSIIQPQMKARKQQFDIFIRNIMVEDICCDGVRLNQVLLNLLSNAIKFTPDGGSVQMTVYQEESPRGEEFIRTHFIVKDTGIGMSEEFQKKIFESFEREDRKRIHKMEGTGLGMTITKYIIDEMQGTIDVSSQVDQGTEFHVCIDFERITEQDVVMKLPPWEMLVVDDDEELCQSAVESLHEIGISGEWASSGMQAIQMAEQKHMEQNGYQIILLDWKMPGMDGLETAREIRKLVGSEVPILLISAYDWSDIEEEAEEIGINGFIAKPLFKSTLYYGLRKFAGDVPEEKEPEKVETECFEGKRILLAEDNELNWEVAQALLSEYGFKLDWVENGKECVEAFENSEPGYYAAILMDIRMPVMDGYQAAVAIREKRRKDAAKIPIIAMTADAFSEDISRCLKCGMNAHVAKPLDMDKLLRLLQKYL